MKKQSIHRSYIKALAAARRQPLSDVAKALGIQSAWLSQVIKGADISLDLARQIERWSGGAVTAARALGLPDNQGQKPERRGQ